jgi:hypothetical protein
MYSGINTLRKLNNFILNHAPWCVFITYAIGFLIWNTYLSGFGFFEYNLIQIRFLSAGLFVLLPTVFFTEFAIFLSGRTRNDITSYALFSFALIWIPLSFLVFPLAPQFLGGAKPIPSTIIGTTEQIKYLSNFGIWTPQDQSEKSIVQSNPVCLIYQNEKYILFFAAEFYLATTTPSEVFPDGLRLRLDEKVISLSKENFTGFLSVDEVYKNTVCDLVKYHSSKTK